MIRILSILIVIAVAAVALVWYSAQSLPDWYHATDTNTDSLHQKLSAQIQQQGVRDFLESKFADSIQGQLVLNALEFKAILMASLLATPNGRALLSVSDAVNVEFHDERAEIGVIVNLDKVAEQDAELREPVQKLLKSLPLLDNSRVFLAVSGRLLAVNGNLAFDENTSVKIGLVPISNKVLKQLGLPEISLSERSLPLKNLSVKSVSTGRDRISLGILPRF